MVFPCLESTGDHRIEDFCRSSSEAKTVYWLFSILLLQNLVGKANPVAKFIIITSVGVSEVTVETV